MTKTDSVVQQEIERLVSKYPWVDSKELFRAELHYLVALAEKEQMIKDRELFSGEDEKQLTVVEVKSPYSERSKYKFKNCYISEPFV